MKDSNGNGANGIEDVKLFLEREPHTHAPLAEGGDFRSPECVELLKQSDIVVTNPPFSLFSAFVAQLLKHRKKFLIIRNTNSDHLQGDLSAHQGQQAMARLYELQRWNVFEVPDSWKKYHHIDEETGRKIARVSTSCWFTNLDHGRRHQPLSLMTMADNLRFSRNLRGKSAYDRYDNYDAIEVGTYKEIPSDYDGVMGCQSPSSTSTTPASSK